MARTKASVGAKVSSGKSQKARCSVAPSPTNHAGGSGSGGSGSGLSGGGGNPVCPRATPRWQTPITNFFTHTHTHTNTNTLTSTTEPGDKDPPAGSSKRPRRNVIHSDDEETPHSEEIHSEEIHSEEIHSEEICVEELNSSVPLQALSGERCHKVDEYYPKGSTKGKGIGKKTRLKQDQPDNGRTDEQTDKENQQLNIQTEESGHSAAHKRERDGDSEQSVTKKVKVNC